MKTKEIEAHAKGDRTFAAAVGYVGEDYRFVGSKALDEVRFIKSLGEGRVRVEIVSGPRDGRQSTVRVQDVYATWEDHEAERKVHEASERAQQERRNRFRTIAEDALSDAGIDMNNDINRCLHVLGRMIDSTAIVREMQPHVYRVETGSTQGTVVHLLDERKFVTLGSGGWRMADRDRAVRLLVKMHVRHQKGQ